jgi:hypothetical protein
VDINFESIKEIARIELTGLEAPGFRQIYDEATPISNEFYKAKPNYSCHDPIGEAVKNQIKLRYKNERLI